MMSGRGFKRRGRLSSISQLPDPAVVDEDSRPANGYDQTDLSATTPKRNRAGSTTSASHNLPSRSYIHNTTSASYVDAQYASPGVRDQTAELSSSFLSDSSMARRFSSPKNETDLGTSSLRPGAIEERSEPASPEGDMNRPSAVAELFNGSGPPLSWSNVDSRSNSVVSPHRLGSLSHVPEVVVTDETDEDMTEASPLMPRERLPSRKTKTYDTLPTLEDQLSPKRRLQDRIPRYPSAKAWKGRLNYLTNPRSWNAKEIAHAVIVRPMTMLPSVFLGLLLNLLDALSYGLILFPLGEDVFSSMGADGVSMFYVSCIVSQLVYASGSIFRGGVGSEMIEVVPFFHKMCFMIMGIMGTDRPEALRATVIVSYAMSSILTGIVFFVLGSARLGTLVSFFPHSILVGCTGGVGIFLILTGVEVSSRLDGGFEFTGDVLKRLATGSSVAQWLPPLVLAVLLLVIKRYYDRPWLVPAYYISITAIFYIITTAVPSITMENLRTSGWVFEAPDAKTSFYNFYSYYRFDLVNWQAVWETVPTQFALTFFGILHVPINIPNLAMKMQEDNVSINRELIMHGVSNTLSGCVGSIQNYLVYVNSVLFMETGGDSRLAGFLLAAATAGLWIAGPVVIGYVPVIVVGTLIYYLGIDLTKEALVDTYGRLHTLEYATIVVIALVMGIHDFVVGVAVGIGLACLVYVVQTSRKTVIRAQFSGAIAESTVRRHPRQRTYLHRVGPQIRVVKLGGYLFFGSIVSVEKTVRAMIDAEAFAASPIRHLVLDFAHVTGIDFSAAEAFGRMNRMLRRRQVEMAFAGVNLQDEVGRALQMDGIFVQSDDEPAMPPPKVYEDLNGALEACENSLLVTLVEKQESGSRLGSDSPRIPIPGPGPSPVSQLDGMVGSPRTNLRHQAATQTISEREPPESKWSHMRQPLALLLQAFHDITSKNEDFWFRAVPYFQERRFWKGHLLYNRHDKPNGFYLLQSGILRAEYSLEQGSYHESIVAGTTCGELPFFSDTERTCKVMAEKDCVAWLLTSESWQKLQEDDADVARELLKVGLKLSAERMNAITSYVLITAS